MYIAFLVKPCLTGFVTGMHIDILRLVCYF